MTDPADIVERLRQTLGGVDCPAMYGDNLAIVLAGAFEGTSEDDGEVDGDTGWTVHAINATNQVLDTIHQHYASLIEAQQAELRKTAMDALLARSSNDELAAEIAELRRIAQAHKEHGREMRAEIMELREALEFYADVSKYPSPLTGGMGDLWADCGEIARAALKETKDA